MDPETSMARAIRPTNGRFYDEARKRLLAENTVTEYSIRKNRKIGNSQLNKRACSAFYGTGSLYATVTKIFPSFSST